jgi:hypothetical protein
LSVQPAITQNQVKPQAQNKPKLKREQIRCARAPTSTPTEPNDLLN